MAEPKREKKSQVPFRINLLFFAVFFLFSILIVRLGIVQIVNGESYKREVESTEDVTVSDPVPRGRMLDRHFNIIVDNVPKSAITYTNSNEKQEDMLEVAENLALLIDQPTNKIREREKKDFWIMRNPDLAKEKIAEEEWEKYENKTLSDKELYQLQINRITEEDLNTLSMEDLEVLAIFREFTSGYAFTQQIVKNEDVQNEEYAAVSENLAYLPGIDTTTDWDRTYKFGNTLKSILGGITDSTEGLPKERLDYYLARDYSLNDRVGKSYLELQYEEVLHGQKAKEKVITKGGKLVGTETITEGARGNDLVLSFDMELQQKVEKILEEEMMNAKKSGRTRLLDRAFVVLMDPYTGEVLTMAGKQLVRNKETGKQEMQDYALGTISSAYGVGSAVKGATVLTGFKTGAINPNTVFYDAPVKVRNTPLKSSWFNGSFQGNMNVLRALRKSSNVYMFKTAMAIGEGNYVYDQPLIFKNKRAFEDMRDGFSEFGLGVRTGIDLPNEIPGYIGQDTLPGKLLDLAIGQFDTYTPMQLAQYVSTIANGGYRIQPRVVREIRESSIDGESLGPIIQEMQPNVLNKLDMSDRELGIVHEGFRQVMNNPDGTAYRAFADAPYQPAGKTGTAEAFYDGPDRKKGDPMIPVMNLSLVAYAPYNNPEIAMSVVVPWAYEGQTGHTANYDIGRRVLDTYFALKNDQKEPAEDQEED
ncbi:penicillin-binding transpeptidase domain-containing protein [Cytobacillus gottheilii]|uniref:penicillin-binding transpeptidase domain-containing protein n=1 Tax=Cytobacillus gottheilii TaxID=859144 RepID=UPI0009B98FF4|nr:penicillin-binding transpeptidase domain-containing protein [Cytobacillus gottheilii]